MHPVFYETEPRFLFPEKPDAFAWQGLSSLPGLNCLTATYTIVGASPFLEKRMKRGENGWSLFTKINGSDFFCSCLPDC